MQWNPADDGQTHINVYSKGKTRLGRQLSNFARTPFRHPEHGHFQSVEGFWYWLSCREDALRGAWGFNAKRLGRKLGGKDWMDDEDFREEIRTALCCKVQQHPKLRDELYDSTLPLAHYYVYGGRVINVSAADWILETLASMR